MIVILWGFDTASKLELAIVSEVVMTISCEYAESAFCELHKS